MSKALKSLMKKVVAKEAHEELAVADAKLGNVIKVRIPNILGDLNVLRSKPWLVTKVENVYMRV